MVKLLLFIAILVVCSFGQGDDGGGCCFYAQKNFEDQIVCTSQPVRNTKPVQSWFCTDGYAANLVKQKAVLAPVLCGDTLPETSRPVDADEIHVFTPCPRFSDCCFYTEDNNGGEEVCIPGNPAPGKVFKSFQCLPGWTPKVKGQDLPCPRPGVAVSFATPVKHDDLETSACEAPPVEPVAETVFEAGAAFSDSENSFNGDAATAEQSLEDTNFFANLESNAPVEDLEVTAETENLALEEDSAGFAVEDANLVAEGDDFAMANDESVVRQSGSAVVSATICLLVGAILLA